MRFLHFTVLLITCSIIFSGVANVAFTSIVGTALFAENVFQQLWPVLEPHDVERRNLRKDQPDCGYAWDSRTDLQHVKFIRGCDLYRWVE
jgi:hypothetical protein